MCFKQEKIDTSVFGAHLAVQYCVVVDYDDIGRVRVSLYGAEKLWTPTD